MMRRNMRRLKQSAAAIGGRSGKSYVRRRQLQNRWACVHPVRQKHSACRTCNAAGEKGKIFNLVTRVTGFSILSYEQYSHSGVSCVSTKLLLSHCLLG